MSAAAAAVVVVPRRGGGWATDARLGSRRAGLRRQLPVTTMRRGKDMCRLVCVGGGGAQGCCACAATADILTVRAHGSAALTACLALTLILTLTSTRPDGSKKAYVRLTTDYDALDVANKIGII